MGILSNFIMGGIGGAAQAGGEILQKQRESDVDLAKQKSFADYASALDTKKLTEIEALRQRNKVDDEGRAVLARREEETYQTSPDRINQLTGAEKLKSEGILGNRVALAPKTAEATQAEFDAGKATRDAVQKEKLSFALDEFRQKSTAELEAEIKKMNDPKYLQGKTKEAAAGRDPNSAALHQVQLEAAQMALKEKKEEAKIPAAVKDEIAGLRELIKGKSAIIDRAVADGSATPEGLAKLESEKSAMGARVTQLRNDYLPEGLRTPDKAAKLVPAPQTAIDRLIANPGKAADFDQLFGPGAAAAVLKNAPAKKSVSKPLPRSMGDIPGVVDGGRVSRGIELLPTDQAKLFQR